VQLLEMLVGENMQRDVARSDAGARNGRVATQATT